GLGHNLGGIKVETGVVATRSRGQVVFEQADPQCGLFIGPTPAVQNGQAQEYKQQQERTESQPLGHNLSLLASLASLFSLPEGEGEKSPAGDLEAHQAISARQRRPAR